jgi:hypothetical protein
VVVVQRGAMGDACRRERRVGARSSAPLTSSGWGQRNRQLGGARETQLGGRSSPLENYPAGPSALLSPFAGRSLARSRRTVNVPR